MKQQQPEVVATEEEKDKSAVITIQQNVAILIDGNNIERSVHHLMTDDSAMLNFDLVIPRLLSGRCLNRLIYFREGKSISSKLAERLHNMFYGQVQPCHKSADIPLSIMATQLASKVDTIIIMSGDADYIELVIHLKSEGVRVEIAAVAETTASLMIEHANYFHPLEKEDFFTYQAKPPTKPSKTAPTSTATATAATSANKASSTSFSESTKTGPKTPRKRTSRAPRKSTASKNTSAKNTSARKKA